MKRQVLVDFISTSWVRVAALSFSATVGHGVVQPAYSLGPSVRAGRPLVAAGLGR